MKFNELPYKRPAVAAVKQALTDLTARLKNARDFTEAQAVFLEQERQADDIATMFTLAFIRHSIDTQDEFYTAEQEYADEALPEIQEYAQRWNDALLESPFRPEFEKKYGRVLFVNAELEKKAFSPAIIPSLQRENALVTQYQNLIASAQIPFEGGAYTLAQLEPFKLDPDDARRLAAWQAEGEFYTANAEQLDALYDELARLRDAMGRELGFDGFLGLGYCRMTRNCYGPDDLSRFRKGVRDYVVPLAARLCREQARRIGRPYPLSYADAALSFRSGNPTPCLTADGILEAGRAFYRGLSPETAEFIDFMFDNELLDVLAKKGKAGGGYCTSLPAHKAPFIFANFNGTAGDIGVMTHEAGHAFHAYLARDIVPAGNREPSAEACEVHSTAMEFFADSCAETFFGADARKYLYSHLAELITFIPYGTQVDHFQHIVYENPGMTPAQRHDAWRELTAVYMPWIRLDGEIPFYGEGKSWQQKHHIYELPLYYIDYCLADAVALQIWAAMLHDKDKAWATYLRYTRLAGTKTFTELVAAAGLGSPFDEDTLKTVCDAAAKWLDNFDMTGIM